jgi:hypothetical protein
MATVEELREENLLLEKNIQLLDALKAKRSALGVQSKVNGTLDGSPSSENYRAHLVRVMQNRGYRNFKGRSYPELLDALASGDFQS